jgi:RNA polymerase sigma-70 factor (ECF subfamily)
MADDSRTGSVLFRLLEDATDQRAWGSFVDRYAPKIYAWCRRWGLQDADAENVTQDVLIRLFRKLPAFAYDPEKGHFRAWLKTLARRVWSDYRDSQQRGGVGSGDSEVLQRLHTLVAREDLLAWLQEAFDLELLEEAHARVRLQVSPRDWMIYQRVGIEGRPGPEVAGELGMSETAVRMAKHRVVERLRRECCRLEGTDPDSS